MHNYEFEILSLHLISTDESLWFI